MTSTPERIERHLIKMILRGDFRGTERLPTMRALAARFETTVPTIQRVIARLEARGLVSAVQGSALHLNDPLRSGDLSLVPAWLSNRIEAGDDPARFLDEFLGIRRTVAVDLLVRHRERIVDGLPHAQIAFEEVVSNAALDDATVFATADLAFARALLRLTGNVPALLVLNTLERLLDELPLVAEALYADRENTIASMVEVLDALVAGGPDAAIRIESAIRHVDEAAVRRFSRLVASSAGNPKAPSTTPPTRS